MMLYYIKQPLQLTKALEGARWKLLLKAEKMFNEDYVDVPLYQMSQSSLYNHEWKGLLYKNAMGAAYTYTYMYKA